MEYKVVYSAYGTDEWEYYVADTPKEAIEMAIADRKEMCEDVYACDYEEYGFASAKEWLESINYKDVENGFYVYYGEELQDWYLDFRVEK